MSFCVEKSNLLVIIIFLGLIGQYILYNTSIPSKNVKVFYHFCIQRGTDFFSTHCHYSIEFSHPSHYFQLSYFSHSYKIMQNMHFDHFFHFHLVSLFFLIIDIVFSTHYYLYIFSIPHPSSANLFYFHLKNHSIRVCCMHFHGFIHLKTICASFQFALSCIRTIFHYVLAI